VGKLANTVGGA